MYEREKAVNKKGSQGQQVRDWLYKQTMARSHIKTELTPNP